MHLQELSSKRKRRQNCYTCVSHVNMITLQCFEPFVQLKIFRSFQCSFAFNWSVSQFQSARVMMRSFTFAKAPSRSMPAGSRVGTGPSPSGADVPKTSTGHTWDPSERSLRNLGWWWFQMVLSHLEMTPNFAVLGEVGRGSTVTDAFKFRNCSVLWNDKCLQK